MEFFDELAQDPEYTHMFNMHEYEVWYSPKNLTIMGEVKVHFNVDRDGVPFYVIGEQYLMGYASEYYDRI